MKTLKDLQKALIKIDFDKEFNFIDNDEEWLTILKFDGTLDIIEQKKCWHVNYNGGTIGEDIKNLQQIYDWIIATMKMNGMRIE